MVLFAASPRRCFAPVASISRCATFLLPPDDQWPRVLLPEWPPYEAAPPPGAYVTMRGSRGPRVARVVSAPSEDALSVVPISTPDASPTTVTRRKAELLRGRNSSNAVLLCGETESFRRLARSQVLYGDVVVEIGCSYGIATRALAARASRVIAVDVSADALRRATEACSGAQYEHVKFELLDATREADLARLAEMVRAARERRTAACCVFVDINGNRAAATVAPLLRDVHERLVPCVTVVKNRELYDAARAHDRACRTRHTPAELPHDAALLPHSDSFWATAVPDGATSGAIAPPALAPPARSALRSRWARPSELLRGWATERVRLSRRARADGHADDAPAHRAMLTSWHTAGPNAAAATCSVRTSSFGGARRIEVRERAGGWRTLHLVSGRRDICNGVVRMAPSGEVREPTALAQEYLKTMAAAGLAALEARSSAGAYTAPVRCLFIGLGAGALPALLAHHLPGACLVAVECDDAACDAALHDLGLDELPVRVVRADALAWVASEAASSAPPRYDAVFVDVFDEANKVPPAFYAEPFLAQLTIIMSDEAVLVHNLHAGSRALGDALDDAQRAYERAVGPTVRLESLDSKPWAGNTVLCASRAGAMADAATLVDAAHRARRRWGVAFDLAARCCVSETAGLG